MTRAADQRLALGSAAVVRPSVAASWLPMSDADAARWLRSRGLIRSTSVPDDEGRIHTIEVVIWGEVLDELAGRRAEPVPERKPRSASLRWIDPE